MIETGRKIAPSLYWLGLGGAGVVSALAVSSLTRQAPPVVVGTITAGLLLTIVTLSWWAWRRLDEVAREAHKSAWYWGGLGGLAIAAGLCVGLARNGHMRLADLGTAVHLAQSQSGAVALGIVICLLAQTVGYALFWSAWWTRKRR